MSKPRLYLFHGNDERTSLNDVRRWLEAFATKYGNSTRYTLEADELGFDELRATLHQVLTTQNLFAEPRFILVRRLLKAGTPTKIRELLSVIGAALPALGPDITVVVWEDQGVPASHVLSTWFADQVAQGRAEVKQATLQAGKRLLDAAAAAADVELSPEAMRWLDGYLRNAERLQRIEAKLRTPDVIASDRRGWELFTLVEAAALLSPNKVIDVPALSQAAGILETAVSPFEIVNALETGDWQEALQRAHRWEREDEGAYFGLMALLRMHFKKRLHGSGEIQARAALTWLAEIEMMSKNVPLRQAWLLDLLILRCRYFGQLGVGALVAPRRLWLSHIQRSGF
jgi:hypothetical protein